MEAAQYINREAGLARIRGNRQLYARMLGMFLASEEFSRLEDALAAGNTAAAGDVAHTIKGMSGNLALDELFRLSAELMGQLRLGSAAPATLEAYRDALRATVVEAQAVIEEFRA